MGRGGQIDWKWLIVGAAIGEIAFFGGGNGPVKAWAIDLTRLLAKLRTDIEMFAAQHPARGNELLFALERVARSRSVKRASKASRRVLSVGT